MKKWLGFFVLIVAVCCLQIGHLAAETTGWQTYKSARDGLEFKYPAGWKVRRDSHTFEQGDIFAVSVWGATQKEKTELYDGASFSVGMPIRTKKDIGSWVKENYSAESPYVESSKISVKDINGRRYYVVDMCNIGCSTTYNTKVGDNIYRFLSITEGPREKEYDSEVEQILNSLQFVAP